MSLSFLFYERKLNTNLTFISGDFPFQGNYLITITHTHTSSNVTVINMNKRNKTYCPRVLSKTLTPFYFRSFFLFRASLTKQHFISGLCHGITFWTTTNTNLHVVLVAFEQGQQASAMCKTFFSSARGKSPHKFCQKKKTIVMLLSAWSLQCFLILVTSQQHPELHLKEIPHHSLIKTLILWVSAKLEL